MMTSHGFSLKRCILDAIFSGLIALIIFGPIAGVVSGHRITKAACAGSFPW